MTITTPKIHPDNRIGYQRTYWTKAGFTPAEVRVFNTSPGLVVHQPSNDWVIIPIALGIEMTGGTAYGGIAGSEDLTLRYGTGTGTVLTTVETTGFLDQTTDPIARWYHVFGATLQMATQSNAGQGLVLSNSGAITLGSPIRVFVSYQFVPASI